MSNIAGIGNAVTQFSTGAVRDVQEDKGRCDLMPLDAVAKVYQLWESLYLEDDIIKLADRKDKLISEIFGYLNDYIYYGGLSSLGFAICNFTILINAEILKEQPEMRMRVLSDTMLEVSKHYKEGTLKYGERNWEKGIPLHSYIDSATRHFTKYIGGYIDERHDRAFIWNLLCCMHTDKYIHEDGLRDLPFCTLETSKNEENES